MSIYIKVFLTCIFTIIAISIAFSIYKDKAWINNPGFILISVNYSYI